MMACRNEEDDESNCWANMPPELIRDVIGRIERSESQWPGRKHVVACAAVCNSWREVTRDLVKSSELAGCLTFPHSLKQVRHREQRSAWQLASHINF